MGDEREDEYRLEQRRTRGLPPLQARRDPPTSTKAAADVARGGKISESERAIAARLVQHAEGLTACELAQIMAGTYCRGAVRDYGWWRLECSRRLGRMADRSSLADGQFRRWTLIRGKARLCRVAGTHQTVWLPRPY